MPGLNGRSSVRNHRARGPGNHRAPSFVATGSKGAVGNFTVSAPGMSPLRSRPVPSRHHRCRTACILHRGVIFAVTVIEDFPSDVSGSLVEAVEIASGVSVGGIHKPCTIERAVLDSGTRARCTNQTRLDEAKISFGKHRGATFYTTVQGRATCNGCFNRAGSIIERQSAQMARPCNSSFQLPAKRSSSAKR